MVLRPFERIRSPFRILLRGREPSLARLVLGSGAGLTGYIVDT